MNLLAAADHLAGLEWSAPRLERQRCLHTLDKYSDCEACFGVCPTGAIETGRPPRLIEERCLDCLACLTACPAGAVTGDDAFASLLTAAVRSEAQTLELICELHPGADAGSPEAGVALRVRGCLAGLGAGAYLALIALGKTKIIVRSEACGHCQIGSLQPRIETQLEDARRLLQAWGYSDVLVEASHLQAKATRPVWEADRSQLSRRDLFRIASRQGQNGLARTLMQDDEVTTQRGLPRQHQRLLKALAHLPAGNKPVDPTVTIRGFAKLMVTEDCTACNTCIRACPTGALQSIENETCFQLTFTPQTCTGCEICAHVCLPNALTVNGNPQLNEVFGQTQPTILHNSELRRCENCRTRFASRSNTRLCPICQARQANPFGAHLVPGLKKVRR